MPEPSRNYFMSQNAIDALCDKIWMRGYDAGALEGAAGTELSDDQKAGLQFVAKYLEEAAASLIEQAKELREIADSLGEQDRDD